MASADLPSTPVEVELKLELPEEDGPDVRNHLLLRRLSRGRSSTKRVRSVYFDTADLALRRQGITLRLRDGRVQTVKIEAEGSAGLFERAEYETTVTEREPNLEAISDAGVRARIFAATTQRDEPLVPMVETEVMRTKRILQLGGAEAEWALDLGEVRTAAGTVPIREMELELMHGEARALYDLALVIHGEVNGRPSLRSKADLGFDVLLGRRPSPSKAKRVQVAKNATVDELLGAIFRECLRHIVANQEPAERGDDPEGVHQMRVGARRFRSALKLFRDLLPAEASGKLREELRWLARELGDARDWDVFCEETLAGPRRLGVDDPGFKHVCQLAEAERQRGQERVRAALHSPRYGALVLSLGRWVEGSAWRDQPLSEHSARIFGPARGDAVARLEHLHRKAVRSVREIDDLPIDDLHRLRILLKRVRYASEFLGSLFGPRASRTYVKRLSALQNSLGHLNDSAVAEQHVDALIRRMEPADAAQPARAAGFLVGWITRGSRDELRGIRRRWRRFSRAGVFWD